MDDFKIDLSRYKWEDEINEEIFLHEDQCSKSFIKPKILGVDKYIDIKNED